MINLRELELGANKIALIENLGHFEKLDNLILAKNKIEKIENLEELTCLKSLNLSVHY